MCAFCRKLYNATDGIYDEVHYENSFKTFIC